MKASFARQARGRVNFLRFASAVGVALALLGLSVVADEITMANGDRYVGKVLSLTNDVVQFQNDNLGRITLPRARVTAIHFGDAAAPPPVASAPGGVAAGAFVAPAAKPRASTPAPATLEQVQAQYLADASPEAKAKFNELASGLMTGRLSVTDIRAQAKTAAAQLRAYQKELGPEATEAFDSYLAILDRFVGDSSPAPAPASASTTPKPAGAKKETAGGDAE